MEHEDPSPAVRPPVIRGRFRPMAPRRSDDVIVVLRVSA
jgi:hypothetical protein